MIRKIVGGLAGVALFVVGTALLVGFVRGAENRAVANQEPIEVLVASQPIAVGDSPVFRTELVPRRLVLDDALRANDSVEDLVATTDLVPGEQLVWSRLGDPAAVESAGKGQVDVPSGFLAVTIPVSAERALGGLLVPGMRVAVIGSFVVEVEDPSSGQVVPAETTNILVHKALVVEVQSEVPPQRSLTTELSTSQLPTGVVLVTLAVPAYDVERIVFAAEWGSIWFAEQNLEADISGTRIQTSSTVFEDPTQAAR